MERQLIEQFIYFCNKNLDLNSSLYAEPYHSLSVCIIDCIFSLRTRYFSVTVPIVKRYAATYMQGNDKAYGDNLVEFTKHIEEVGGCSEFTVKILKNNQKLSGRLKSEICYELAKKLLLLNINTIEDFQNFQPIELLETVISSVKGIGAAGLNYLFMLAGDPNRCKPDVHIHHCIRDACGIDISNDNCQKLFTEAVDILKINFPYMSVRLLDGIIWKKYQAKPRKNLI